MSDFLRSILPCLIIILTFCLPQGLAAAEQLPPTEETSEKTSTEATSSSTAAEIIHEPLDVEKLPGAWQVDGVRAKESFLNNMDPKTLKILGKRAESMADQLVSVVSAIEYTFSEDGTVLLEAGPGAGSLNAKVQKAMKERRGPWPWKVEDNILSITLPDNTMRFVSREGNLVVLPDPEANPNSPMAKIDMVLLPKKREAEK